MFALVLILIQTRVTEFSLSGISSVVERLSWKQEVSRSIRGSRTMFCIVAQLVEHAAVNRFVAGSIPADAATLPDSQAVRQSALNRLIAGSNPALAELCVSSSSLGPRIVNSVTRVRISSHTPCVDEVTATSQSPKLVMLVQIQLGAPRSCGVAAKHAPLSRVRSRVQISSGPNCPISPTGRDGSPRSCAMGVRIPHWAPSQHGSESSCTRLKSGTSRSVTECWHHASVGEWLSQLPVKQRPSGASQVRILPLAPSACRQVVKPADCKPASEGANPSMPFITNPHDHMHAHGR
jgi:hypothetical protein